MRKNPLLLLGTFLLLSLLLPAKTMLAAPNPQLKNQTLQIVLVLDVSGSMSTPVYTGIVPEDLLSLLLRMDQIIQDPEYKDLQDQIKEAENEEAVQEAKENRNQAYEDLTDWIADDQGVSFQEVQADIRTALEEAGCEGNCDRLIATAGSINKILNYLYGDCPLETNEWILLEEIRALMPYLEDPEYLEMRDEWLAANQEYDQALYDSGFTSLSARLETYKQDTGMEDLQDEIDRLVIEYGIPSRLDQAKNAANNLIDLSKLDLDRTGRESLIGLVTFSNQALFEHSLTLDHEDLKPLINSMRPLEQTNIGDGLEMGLSELENNADPDHPLMVILLSDGHANVGLSSSEILSIIPKRANESDIILCTAGFADLETEVDFLLLEGLADQTDGEYLFTNNGAELGSFFAACREAAAGKDLVDQISGVVAGGDFQEVSQVDVESNTCELSLTLNYLSGAPLIELTDPDGEILDLETEGVEYQSQNQVQLLTVTSPDVGEWSITLTNDEEDEDAVFSLVISTESCQGDEKQPGRDIEPTSSIPFLLTNRGLKFLTGGLIALVVIFGGAVTLLINFRQRRSK
jgi:Mg-chelatase subunit ChlD